MEKIFKTPLSAITLNASEPTVGCLGFIDGSIQCVAFDTHQQGITASSKNTVSAKTKWKKRMKRSVRALQSSVDGSTFCAASSNRAVCIYDIETSKRLRCIREGHKSRPNAMTLLPTCIGGQQFATGTEIGEIKSWDFRESKPNVATFRDQDDIIYALCAWKNSLLAVSGDGTLAVYDLYKRKMRIQSETMHSELLCLAVADRFTYVGAADGHIEVFNNGEFGNIRDRIETPFLMGVEQLALLRNNLLLATSSTFEEMRFVHVDPNKTLDGIPYPGGVDLITKAIHADLLLTTSADGTRLGFHSISDMIKDVPELMAHNMHEFSKRRQKRRRKQMGKKSARDSGFFKDLCSEDEGDDDETGGYEDEDEETEEE